MLRLALFLFLLALVGVSVGTFLWIGWWALVVVPVAVVVLLRLAMRPLLKELFLLPFKAKGSVLRGADVTVHSIVAANPPGMEVSGMGVPGLAASGEAAREDPFDRAFFHLDVTIAPRSSMATMTFWEPGELLLVRPEFMIHPDGDDDDACVVSRIDVFRDGGFQPDEEGKYQGEQRLRMLIGVQPPHTRLKLQYYFESLGDVAIPSSIMPIPVRAATMPS